MELTKRMALFGRTRALESEIDQFFDKTSQSALIFKLAVKVYLGHGLTDEFEEKLNHVNDLESQADRLRRARDQSGNLLPIPESLLSNCATT